MKELFKELADIIEAEIAVQEKTIQSLNEQREIFVNCTLDQLEENLKSMDLQRLEAQALDKSRNALKERIALRLGIQGDQATLTHLSTVADGQLKEDLEQLKERLLETAKRLRKKSRQNMLLIKQSLELNFDLINQVQGKESRERQSELASTYSSSGELVCSSSSQMLDKKL